jgi:4-diphosphocytidyl-2-C-methyl-D-erythritol kinase
MKDKFNLPNVFIHLHKQIPFGAGLGGGSSDASHTLILLNKLFELELSNEELKKIAKEIGADCSFFIDNQAAFVSGIGDKIEIVDNFLKGKHIKLFKPKFGISTAEAYSGVKISGEKFSKHYYKDIELSDYQSKFKNDFELHLFKKYPLLASIKSKILDSGAFYSSMTGSGSVIYGLYNSDIEINKDLEKFLIWKGEI